MKTTMKTTMRRLSISLSLAALAAAPLACDPAAELADAELADAELADEELADEELADEELADAALEDEALEDEALEDEARPDELALEPDQASQCYDWFGPRNLWAGQSIYSCENLVRITMQTDGNLVAYSYSGQVLWNSNTGGTGANRAAFQTDGNIVLYGPSGAVWATNTSWPPSCNAYSFMVISGLNVWPSFPGWFWAITLCDEVWTNMNGVVY